MEILQMKWENVLFANYPIDPQIIQNSLPKNITVDTYNNQAFLSIVPFQMSEISLKHIPYTLSFNELNLRTYVQLPDGTKGVYFYTLESDDKIGTKLAQNLFNLPYKYAEMSVKKYDNKVHFKSARNNNTAKFNATYKPKYTNFTPPKPNTLQDFLTERYQFITESKNNLYKGTISHKKWKLSEASITIQKNTLFNSCGFTNPDRNPIVYYSPKSSVTATNIQKI